VKWGETKKIYKLKCEMSELNEMSVTSKLVFYKRGGEWAWMSVNSDICDNTKVFD